MSVFFGHGLHLKSWSFFLQILPAGHKEIPRKGASLPELRPICTRGTADAGRHRTAEEDEEGKDLVSYGDCSPSLGCSVCIFKMCSLDRVNISQKLT